MLLFLFEFYRYFLTILFKQNIGAILSAGWKISRYCSNKVIITVTEFTGINYYPTRPVFHFHHHHHYHHHHHHLHHISSSSSSSSSIIIIHRWSIIIIVITITIVVVIIIANNTPAEFCLKLNQGVITLFQRFLFSAFTQQNLYSSKRQLTEWSWAFHFLTTGHLKRKPAVIRYHWNFILCSIMEQEKYFTQVGLQFCFITLVKICWTMPCEQRPFDLPR